MNVNLPEDLRFRSNVDGHKTIKTKILIQDFSIKHDRMHLKVNFVKKDPWDKV